MQKCKFPEPALAANGASLILLFGKTKAFLERMSAGKNCGFCIRYLRMRVLSTEAEG